MLCNFRNIGLSKFRFLTLFTVAFFGLMLASLAQPAASPSTTACVTCHRDSEQVGDEGVEIARLFVQDVHQEAGLSCQDCHGGNPDPSLADDMTASMDDSFRSNPFRGKPARPDIPRLCGKCHSDATFMKGYKPDIRVDQEQEYYTSVHGQALRRGDQNVATCIDCHNSHGILRASDSRAPVYPTQVAETCRRCHSDATRMAGYLNSHGQPLPIDQFEKWRQSVHAVAMFDRGDISAPTCNDCHGNHGATPPGLQSIGFVCGQCHGREATLFRASTKHELWQGHNEFLAEAGPEGCRSCHEDGQQPAQVTDVHSFSECTSCHSNHGIVRPTVAHFSPLPATPCLFCHEGQGPFSDLFPEDETVQEHYQEVRDQLLEDAARAGVEGDDRFDWMVDQALALPFHRRDTEDPGEATLRPEFQNLFTKFRIGKTYYQYPDPTSKEMLKGKIVRCNHCHSATDSTGTATGKDFLDQMMELTSLTGRAERLLLRARRGGIETRDALAEVDQAVNAQISLEAMIHSFNPEDKFREAHDQGVNHASTALASARQAHAELRNRRTGLLVSLFFILLVLIGLAVKIRQLPG